MLLRFLLLGTPKVQWKMKKHPFLKENVDDADVWKTHPFDAFFGHGWVASHVVSDPSPPLPPPPPDPDFNRVHKSDRPETNWTKLMRR